MNNDPIFGKMVTRRYVSSLQNGRPLDGERPDNEQVSILNKRIRLDVGKDGLQPNSIPYLISKDKENSSVDNDNRVEVENGNDNDNDTGDNNDNNHDNSNDNDDNDDDDTENEDTVRNTMNTLLVTPFEGPATHVSDDLDSQIRQYSSPNSHRSAREIFIENENITIAKLGKDFIKQARKNYTLNRITDISAYGYDILTRLAKRYFTWMNSAHPVLHECILQIQLDKCCRKSKLVKLNDQFQVTMVIAISLASIGRSHLSTSEIGRISHDFWKSATKLRGKVLFGNGIIKLQNILLLLQYTLLVPKAGNLWQLSGSAMRFATEMGLYAEPNPSQNFDPLSLDLRRRIFWTCYCIDRILATVMGRPVGLPDSWISAKYPASVEDKLITVHGIEPGPICHLKIAQIQQIRIYRLQSDIHKHLYAPVHNFKLPDTDLCMWSWQMYDQLRVWRGSLTHPTPLITREWTELQFHIAIVLLFRPSPNRPKVSNEALHVAFHSAGEVMRLVKMMHRECSAVFSWLTIQNLFMCGLTFVNSLKELAERTPNQLCISFVEIFLKIQSCTAMLETLSALEAGANEKIRNAFEMISSNVLRSVTNISPSLVQQLDPMNCVWLHIAKSDNITIARPTQIEGISIPIQGNSSFHRTEMQNWENFSIGHADEHFAEHDMDASTKIGMLELSLETNAYTISKRRGSRSNLISTNIDGISTDRNSGFADQSNQNIINTESFNTFEDPMERMTAITNAAAAAEPINDIGGWPDETNLGAELDRWFLYPFPETSEQFTL